MNEVLDSNKTALTHRVTAVAMAYLDGAGFKPIETEVPVAGGWIADIASFVYPTPSEAKKLKFNRRFGDDPNYRWYDELHFRHGHLFTAVVEVKVSKSDFQKDSQRKFNGAFSPAHLLYLAYPAGLIEDKDLPEGWMGLKCSKDGKKLLKRVGWPTIHPMHPGDIADFIAQVAIRRDHQTRYGHYRSMLKRWRAEDKESNKQFRLKSAIDIIAAWIRGDSYLKSYPDLKAALESRMVNCGNMERELDFLNNLKRKEA